MTHSFRSTAGILSACLLLLAVEGCSTASEVTSIAPSTPIVIDGKSDDWAGHLLYYRNEKLTIGVSNDKNFVYLCVMSSDQSVYGTMLMRGLTVWFDTTAGRGKYFGIRFPLDAAPPEMQQHRDDQPGSFDEMLRRRADDATKLAVVTGAKETRTELLVPTTTGLDARISYKPGVFVYEMKVPMGVDIADGLKLGFTREGELTVRLETTEAEKRPSSGRDKQQGGMSEGGGESGMQGEGGMQDEGGMQGEGGRGGRGRRGGRQGGMEGMNGMHKGQSIDFLMKVQRAR